MHFAIVTLITARIVTGLIQAGTASLHTDIILPFEAVGTWLCWTCSTPAGHVATYARQTFLAVA
jgi:hypothetical protein